MKHRLLGLKPVLRRPIEITTHCSALPTFKMSNVAKSILTHYTQLTGVRRGPWVFVLIASPGRNRHTLEKTGPCRGHRTRRTLTDE
jgi:hypothetical protein